MKYNCLFGVLILAFMSVISFPLTAFADEKSYETEVINNINLGDISISLSEYELDDEGKEIPYKDDKCVLPGQTVGMTVRIKNLANPAWIRVRFSFISDDGELTFPPGMVTPADERWVERGGTFYYSMPLRSREEVDLMSGISIPYFWGEEAAGKSFSLIIKAEAVQEANFTPDLTADDPWFGTLIETCVHNSYEEIPVSMSYGSFSVLFEGGAEGLVHIGDDLFENFGTLMPGDTGSGTVSLRNNYAEPIALCFRTEGKDEGILANEAVLTIRDEESVIFSGRLSESHEEVQIAWLENGKDKDITYSIFIPPECGNSYAVTNAADKWIFRASLNEDENAADESIANGRHTGKGGGAAESKETVSDLPSPKAEPLPFLGALAKAGEGGGMLGAVILMAVSGAALAGISGRSFAERSEKRGGAP